MSRTPSNNPRILSGQSSLIYSASPADPLESSQEAPAFVSTPSRPTDKITSSPQRPKPLPHVSLTPKPTLLALEPIVPSFDLSRTVEIDNFSTPSTTSRARPPFESRVISPLVENAHSKLAIAALHHSTPDREIPDRKALDAHALNFARDNIDDIEVAISALGASSRPLAGSDVTRESLRDLAVPSIITHIGDIQTLILKTYHQQETPPEGSNWEFLFNSKSIKSTLGYYGQVWINREKMQIVLVSSGTKLYFSEFEGSSLANLFGVMHLVKDLVNDLQLFANFAPTQYKGVRKFIDFMIKTLTADKSLILDDYDLIFAGHSLGAITSDMGMLYTRSKYDLEAHSLTMENPGSEPSMKILAESLKKQGMPTDLNSVKKYCKVVNNSPNWINTACKQFGDVYLNLVSKYQEQQLPAYCKFLPDSIRELLLETLKQFEFHDKGYFRAMPDMKLQENWPDGVFKGIMIEKVANAVTSLEKTILGSPFLSSLLVDVVKLIKAASEKTAEAKQKVIEIYDGVKHDATEFLGYLESYDEVGGIGDLEGPEVA